MRANPQTRWGIENQKEKSYKCGSYKPSDISISRRKEWITISNAADREGDPQK